MKSACPRGSCLVLTTLTTIPLKRFAVITLESNAMKTPGFYSGMCLDILHHSWPPDKAALHRVWAGASPGVRLWPHRGVWRAHDQPADHGQVLRLQAAPPPHRHREHLAPRVQVRRFSPTKGRYYIFNPSSVLISPPVSVVWTRYRFSIVLSPFEAEASDKCS